MTERQVALAEVLGIIDRMLSAPAYSLRTRRVQIIQGKQGRPRRVMLYGTHGIGKSTWAAEAPSPIFLQCEEGLDDIGVDRTPLLSTFGDVSSALSWLASNEHEYRTIVIDTLDWLERLVHDECCQKHGKNSIEEFV